MQTELLIHAKSARKWQVVIRPITKDVIDAKDIVTLFEATRKDIVMAYAKGRALVTGEPIIEDY